MAKDKKEKKDKKSEDRPSLGRGLAERAARFLEGRSADVDKTVDEAVHGKGDKKKVEDEGANGKKND